MPRGMTTEEAYHYLATDQLPDDVEKFSQSSSLNDISYNDVSDFMEIQSAPITGEKMQESLTAAYTGNGAMIAFIPMQDDAQRLSSVSGGEPVEELHCTVKYFPDAAAISNEQRALIISTVAQCAASLDSIEAEGFAIAIFNPANPDRDPCTTLLLSSEELWEAYQYICADVHQIPGLDFSQQYMPWIPHITLAYENNTDLGKYVELTGPVEFDRVRISFGPDDTYDIPFGGHDTYESSEIDENNQMEQNYPETEDVEASPGAEQMPVDSGYSTDFDLNNIDVQGWLNEYIAWAKERDVNIPGGPGHQLRDYWTRGPGAAKIRWGTEGDGTRCIKHMRKYVGVRAGGLCQEYHRIATGKSMHPHPGKPTE